MNVEEHEKRETCMFCGKPLSRKQVRFCSVPCHTAQRKAMKMQKINEYDENFTQDFRELIRALDRNRCQMCNCFCDPDPRLVYKSKTRRYSCIHHIDGIGTNTTVFNCILLCVQCHAEAHYDMKYWIPILHEKTALYHERI